MGARVEITFGDGVVDEGDRPRISAVLRKLARETSLGGSTEPLDRIDVRRELSGGGGAVVLDILVHRGASRFARVVKIGTVEQMRAEWRGWDVVRRQPSDLCPPIEAATAAVRDSKRVSHEPEAVVYSHLASFLGDPQAPLTTIEDVFAAASMGEDKAAWRAMNAVISLFTRARHVFYDSPQRQPVAKTLRELISRLGPDLVVEVDSVTADGWAQLGGRRTALRERWPEEILDAGMRYADDTAASESDGGAGIRTGDRALIRGLTWQELGGGLVGYRDDASVRIAVAPDADAALTSALVEETGPGEVNGRVVRTRAADTWQWLRRTLTELTGDADTIRAPGVTAAHPFAVRRALRQIEIRAVLAPGHGDLNSRNVLLVDSPDGQTPADRPYLIDYATARDERHLVEDFVWLEINLLRAVHGDPDLSELVRLNRTLTTAAYLFPLLALGPTGQAREDRDADTAVFETVTGALLPQLAAASPRLAMAWTVLARVRWEAYRLYPRDARADWFVDYHRHLVLAAHRTLKWRGDLQSPTRLRASVAAAAVAVEWLGPDEPFRYWSDHDLTRLATSLPTMLAGAGASAAVLVGAIAAEVDRRRLVLPQVETALTTVGGTVAAAALSVDTPAGAREPFIDLAIEPIVARAESELTKPELAEGASDGGEPTDPDQPATTASAVAVLGHPVQAVLVGPSGVGKTTVVRELADRMTAVLTRPGPVGTGSHRIPVLISAAEVVSVEPGDSAAPGLRIAARVAVAAPVGERSATHLHELMRAGCVHLIVDGIAGTPARDRGAVLSWVREVRQRYPRTPVLVCDRTHSAARLPFPAFRLVPPSRQQAVSYLTDVAARRQIPAAAVDAVLSAAAAEQTAALLQRPLFLAMLGRQLASDTVPTSVGDLLDAHFDQQLTSVPRGGHPQAVGAAASPPASGKSPPMADVRRLAGRLAAYLVDRDLDAVTEARLLEHLDANDRDRWPLVRRVLIDHDVVSTGATGLRFRVPIYRDYFAATVIDQEPQTLPTRARQLSWQPPLRVAASRSTTDPELVPVVLAETAQADPPFAGQVLAAAPGVDDQTVAWFVGDQVTVLTDPRSGHVAADRAAAALVELGSRGVRALARLVRDRRAPLVGRLAGLSALRTTTQAPDQHATRAAARPTALINQLLTDPAEPTQVRVAAVGYAADLRAPHLALVIAEAFRADAPWPYLRQAYGSFATLGVPIPPRLHQVYLEAAERRLYELERALPSMTLTQPTRLAQRERCQLLRQLSPTGVDLLLDRRFSFEIDEDIRTAIDELVTAGALEDSQTAQVLRAQGTADSWIGLFTGGDDRVATAAAHRVLRDAPQHATDLVAAVGSNDSPPRLRAAAVAATESGAASLPHLERLVLDLLTTPLIAARLEPLASLLASVAAIDSTRGGQLAEHVYRVLVAAGDPARLHWPLRGALARCLPRPAQWETLLRSTDDGHQDLAVAALAASGFHLDASPAQRPPLSATAQQRLAQTRPAEPASWAAVDFVRAAARAQLPDGLTMVRAMLDQPAVATMLRQVSHGRYGVIELAALAEVLSAGGFLTRHCLITGDTTTTALANDIANQIATLDTATAHPSVTTGKLIALGYLGDPGPLLRQLDSAEPRLHAAAIHAVQHWTVDGPRTPMPWRDPQQAAAMIAELLHNAEHPPAAQSTLLTILDRLQQQTGWLAGPTRTPGQPN